MRGPSRRRLPDIRAAAAAAAGGHGCGGALGLAVLATVSVNATANMLGGTHPGFGQTANLATKTALTHGYSVAFFIASLICLAGVLATFLIPRSTGKAMMKASAPEPAH